VQDRYDDVLVQESRELPEKVYQELVAEVRKGVPLLPDHTSGTSVQSEQSEVQPTRCNAILELGFLKDERAIPELGRLLDDDVNKAKSCYTHSISHINHQEFSAYLAAILSLSQFQDSDTFRHLKNLKSQDPSQKLLNIWRDFHRRELEKENLFPDMKTILSYDSQPIPDLEKFLETHAKNKKIIELLRDKSDFTTRDKIREKSRVAFNESNLTRKENIKEELLNIYVKDILALKNSWLPIKLRDRNNDPDLKDFAIKQLSKTIAFPPLTSPDEDFTTRHLLKLPGLRKKVLDIFEDKDFSVVKSNIAIRSHM
jgi:hypothetical protein